MKINILFLFFLFSVSCNTGNHSKNSTSNPDSCFTIYKIIVRPNNSIADSIFVNCTNNNLFFHKKISNEGKLQSTGYLLNNQLHGNYTVYEDDGKTVSWSAFYNNGNKIK